MKKSVGHLRGGKLVAVAVALAKTDQIVARRLKCYRQPSQVIYGGLPVAAKPFPQLAGCHAVEGVLANSLRRQQAAYSIGQERHEERV